MRSKLDIPLPEEGILKLVEARKTYLLLRDEFSEFRIISFISQETEIIPKLIKDWLGVNEGGRTTPSSGLQNLILGCLKFLNTTQGKDCLEKHRITSLLGILSFSTASSNKEIPIQKTEIVYRKRMQRRKLSLDVTREFFQK